MQQCATWYVAWGLTDGERRCTGFHTLVSIFLWAYARRLRALVHSRYPLYDRCLKEHRAIDLGNPRTIGICPKASSALEQ